MPARAPSELRALLSERRPHRLDVLAEILLAQLEQPGRVAQLILDCVRSDDRA